MKNITTIATIVLLSASLAACGPRPELPQVPQQFENPIQQAPVPQAQQADDGIGMGTVAAAALGGAVLGHMAGKGSANSQPQRTVIIDNRQPNYGYRNNGYYNKGYGYGKKVTTTTTTTKRSMFGGTKTVTRTVTKRRR